MHPSSKFSRQLARLILLNILFHRILIIDLVLFWPVLPFCPSKKTVLTWLCQWHIDQYFNVCTLRNFPTEHRDPETVPPIFLSNKSRLNKVSPVSSLKSQVWSCANLFSDNQSLLSLDQPPPQVQSSRSKMKLCVLWFGKSNARTWLYYKTLDKLPSLEGIMQIQKHS